MKDRRTCAMSRVVYQSNDGVRYIVVNEEDRTLMSEMRTQVETHNTPEYL